MCSSLDRLPYHIYDTVFECWFDAENTTLASAVNFGNSSPVSTGTVIVPGHLCPLSPQSFILVNENLVVGLL